MHSGLRADFSQILEPVLVEHGFQRINLTACIQNEELWRKGRLWFGASLDWRDQYLEINLGHLYWFRDVMPRVIVLGDYSSYGDFKPYEKFKSDGLAKTLAAVRDSFGHALEVYRDRYDEILQARRQPKKSKYAKEYIRALGDEVKDEELKEYYA
jgi:hypothetical protein